MNEQEFKQKSLELIKSMVNTIANKEYVNLISIIPPEASWASYQDAEETPENACLGFGQWLDEQLAMWEEDEDKEFVVDSFDESGLEEIVLKKDNTSLVCYNPTSYGESLDFWFEIKLKVNGDRIIAKFDVNI